MLISKDVEEKMNSQKKIITTAEMIFADKGYASTRVSEIAKAAQVNVALINYYFESKEKLYHDVLEGLFSKWGLHIKELSWDQENPRQVLAAYIEKHFEFKWNNENLFRILQWETLSQEGIYHPYIKQYWIKDVYEKQSILKKWKKEGLIHPSINENAILAAMWGIMDRFLFSREEELKLFLGLADRELTAEQLREQCIVTIQGIILNGVFSSPQVQNESHSNELTNLHVIPLAEEPTEDLLALVEALKSYENVTFFPFTAQVIEQVSQNQVGVLWIVSSQFGMLSQESMKSLEQLEQFAKQNELVDIPAGVWVINGETQAQSLQIQLERTLDRFGMFVLQRQFHQSLDDYMKRFIKFIEKINKE